MIDHRFRLLCRRFGLSAASRRRQEVFGRRAVPLGVEVLEDRLTLSAATVVAASFFDSAVYEFDASTGAVLKTLVAPNSQAVLSGPPG